jgi:hypothetical protein
MRWRLHQRDEHVEFIWLPEVPTLNSSGIETADCFYNGTLMLKPD